MYNFVLDFLSHSRAMRPMCGILNNTTQAAQANITRVLPFFMWGAPQCHKQRDGAHDGIPRDISSPTVSPQEVPHNHLRCSTQARKWVFFAGFVAPLRDDPDACAIMEKSNLVLAFLTHPCAMAPICAENPIWGKDSHYYVFEHLAGWRNFHNQDADGGVDHRSRADGEGV